MELPIRELEARLGQADVTVLPREIVNAPFNYKVEMVHLGIGIIVLLVHDEKDGQIHRITLSATELAHGTLQISHKKFEDIKIPVDHADNIISRAVTSQKPQMTVDWKYLFTPALSPEQARLNQAGGGIACSHVYPLSFNGHTGALIFSYYKEPTEIGAAERQFMQAYSNLVSGRLDAGHVEPGMLLSFSAA